VEHRIIFNHASSRAEEFDAARRRLDPLLRPFRLPENLRKIATKFISGGCDVKRYLIFAGLGPLIGGFLLLLVTTILSGYWNQTDLSEVRKFFAVALSTLQFSYLFGLLPALLIGSIDDILSHVSKINAAVRMLMVGGCGFAAAELLYGSRGPDSGAKQFILYGLVGLIPAMLSSWLSADNKTATPPARVAASPG
jgi:Family of unknown function (DUF5413)